MTLGLGDLAFVGALGPAYEADAQAYITAVETADGQALETGVREAINAFVVGCKADGIWSAIKASCILAGARTLSGALVPLAGTAPTNFNFVAGDYNRKAGLVGNGSTKYLNTNRNNNADPRDNNHNAVYATSLGTQGGLLIGAAEAASSAGVGSNGVFVNGTTRNRAATGETNTNAAAIGFSGMSRANSGNYVVRFQGQNSTKNRASDGLLDAFVWLYRRQSVQDLAPAWFNGTLAFYSIGESLDLALLDARVTTLINALAAAIP